jgi:hypothetical protein
MWILSRLTKRPTPSEYAVIAVVISGGLIVLGAIALIVALRAPASKHDAAISLMHYGFWSLGIGILIAFAFWLVRRFTH